MAAPRTTVASRPLSAVLPPLVLGTATFNYQYVSDPGRMPSVDIVSRALDLGVTAFDTSPYYGPSESILGDALRSLSPPRESYFLVTKAGRIAPTEFDYSPAWIRASVRRSLDRLNTSYLDLVYTHDAEFVSPDDVVAAVRELRRLRDEEGLVRYIGICGYPVPVLCDLAEKILRETGEPIDAVQSFSHFCVQNNTLGSDAVLSRLRDAGVGVVTNASMLSMGLLTTRGVDDGPMASWHPAPSPLRKLCKSLAVIAEVAGEKMEDVALYWAMSNWARVGRAFGSELLPPTYNIPTKVGVSVMGVTSVPELEETVLAWQTMLHELVAESSSGGGGDKTQSNASTACRRHDKIQRLVTEQMWPALGDWRNYSWASPGEDFVNQRAQQASTAAEPHL
ncbi:L-galactose dehydrogenase [Colletotrichum higginsianum]|uniref:L-galactose dehydrogenase n=2 Tax=Colletotrichum higginsianum TaxID=80884 RepID=H1VQE0_COLHI|nr:L-galactose dehydrogenase [Colletotrichum higginsianum IMI 349063]OBR11235.1 L-galactose dehydrogenase [Colletotrichum higginsianum IMI 349063]TIC91287.1 D-arabinose 1-dehydrogenase [Colletotrichum higginsianum]GJD01458.1 L-galactose dehydrogenase [Colletotrichum higginsianum]CCF42446.1 L-galactose dehydrogenase [Colletotrichum higginsianum]